MINKGSPINANSKKENPSNPCWIRALLAIIFGGVPVKVSNPPVFEPNATGINSLEGKVPIFQAAEIVTGSSVATVPVLLTKPDSTPEPRVTMTSNLGTLLPAHWINLLPANAVHPVWESPSPIINSAAIIITVELLKPLKVSVTSKIPVRNRLSIDNSATTSGGYLPQINKPIVITKMINIIYI